MDAESREPANSRVLIGLLLVLLLAGFGVAGLRGSGDGGSRGAGETPVSADVAPGEAAPDTASVSGRVWLEPDLDPELEEPPEDMKLTPAGTCIVRAWQKSTRLAEARCQADGTYRLSLPSDARGQVAVEVLVPGRLRAVLPGALRPGQDVPLQEVALGWGQVLAGQVVDAAGEPVPGVDLQAMPDPDLGEPEPWRTRSGADGMFRFDTLPPGPIILRAWKRGYATSVVQAIAPAEDLLVVLDGLVQLRGTLVAEGKLPDGARVRLEGSGVWPAREVTAGPDGSFVFERVPDGVYALEALAETPDGKLWAAAPVFDVEPGDRPALQLQPAVRLPVRVLDPSRQAVARARVTVTPAELSLLQRLAEAGPDGEARVGPLAPGSYVITADADGYLPARAVTVEITAEAPERVTLTLGRPGRIEGVVVDARGEPVEGAAVYADADGIYAAGSDAMRAEFFDVGLRASGSLGVTEEVPDIPVFASSGALVGEAARTGPHGRFVIGGLVAGRYRLSAEKGGHARSGEVAVTLRSGEVRKGVRLQLKDGWRLTGRIVDGNDRPVPGAWIELEDGTVTRTDERGVFDAGLHRGPVTGVVRSPGMTPRRIQWDVRDGDTDVELALQPAEGRVEGRVRDGNDQPIADAMVTIRLLDGLTPTTLAWTDDRGVFEAPDLPDGAAEILVQHPEYSPIELRVEAGARADPVELSLQQGWTVAVEVLALGTRDPIEGATVTVGELTDETDAAGRVQFPNQPRGATAVTVEAPGRVPARVTVMPEGEAPVTTARVELGEGGSLEGVVTDYRGDPVPGARVVVQATGGRELSVVRSDARGTFAFDGLGEGAYRLRADPPPGREAELAPATLETDVLRGKVTRGLDLRFDRA